MSRNTSGPSLAQPARAKIRSGRARAAGRDRFGARRSTAVSVTMSSNSLTIRSHMIPPRLTAGHFLIDFWTVELLGSATCRLAGRALEDDPLEPAEGFFLLVDQ